MVVTRSHKRRKHSSAVNIQRVWRKSRYANKYDVFSFDIIKLPYYVHVCHGVQYKFNPISLGTYMVQTLKRINPYTGVPFNTCEIKRLYRLCQVVDKDAPMLHILKSMGTVVDGRDVLIIKAYTQGMLNDIYLMEIVARASNMCEDNTRKLSLDCQCESLIVSFICKLKFIEPLSIVHAITEFQRIRNRFKIWISHAVCFGHSTNDHENAATVYYVFRAIIKHMGDMWDRMFPFDKSCELLRNDSDLYHFIYF
jgi:hypothetical protein